MYTIDERDRAIELKDVPQSTPGVPLPVVFADEDDLILAYGLATPHENRMAVIRFEDAGIHVFGYPNDEGLGGHPLWERGLKPYSAHVVRDSSWVRSLRFAKDDRHFVFTFHDSTFECVAKSYKVSEIPKPGPQARDLCKKLMLGK